MRIQPAAPYQSLAPFYDGLMAHVDYPLWADLARSLWDLHAPGPLRSVHDAACGTGRFLEAIHESGLRLGGCDASAEMLEVARRRLGNRARLRHTDLRQLDGPAEWDLVTCLYDSLNYLLEAGELTEALARLGRLCAPGGLLVFDVCTERNSLSHFLDRTERGHHGDWEWERHSWYERGPRLHHNDFLVEHLPSGRRWAESHTQRVYPVAEVEACARLAGLSLVARTADFTLRPGGENSDRVHFAARPAGGAA